MKARPLKKLLTKFLSLTNFSYKFTNGSTNK